MLNRAEGKNMSSNGEVAVSLPMENGTYSPRPPHSPTISTARSHNQASNTQVSSVIRFGITYFTLHSICTASIQRGVSAVYANLTECLQCRKLGGL